MTKRHLLSASAALAIAISAIPAIAQTTPDEFAGESSSGDIIVTATRRADKLSNVPIAISAVTQEALQNSGANDIRQLNQLAPSLLVSSTTSESSVSARIRGVGTVGDNVGLESSVAVFIDGVYRSRTGAGLNELGEIDRVEVLRGPQGTLFGRNASAGLLNITTKKPEFTLGGMGEVSYQNYDGWRLQGAITGPITQTLAARLDAVYVKRDGFMKDVNTGDRVNDRNRVLVRGQLLWEPTDAVSLRLIGDYTHRNEACCGAVYATPAVSQANAGLISPSNPIIPVMLDVAHATFDQYFPGYSDPYSRKIAFSPNRSYKSKTEDWGLSGQLDWQFGGVQMTSITAYRDYKAGTPTDADYGLADILYFGDGSQRRIKTFSQELRFQGSLFDDRLDWLVGGYYAHEKIKAASELKFGDDYGAFASCRMLASISGAIPRNADQAGCRAGANGAITDSVLTGIFGPGANRAGLLINGLNILSGVNDVGDDLAIYNQTSNNFAFFTHNIFHITDTLSLTLGVRYTNEKKDFDANITNNNNSCVTMQNAMLPYLVGGQQSTVPASLLGGLVSLACQGNSTSELNGLVLKDTRKENKFTGTAVLSWKPMSDLMLYGSYSRGYKAGGFNLDRSSLKSPILPFSMAGGSALVKNLQFAEETVNAYEVGAKFSHRGVSLNLALFRQEFKNFQLNTFNGTVYVVQNINACKDSLNGADKDGSAATGACGADNLKPGLISQGVEIEASVSPVRDITASFGVTYADTHYANDLVGSSTGAPLDPALRLLPGAQISNAPAWVVTSSLAFTPEVGSSGMRALFYVDGRLSDGYNTGSDLLPQKYQQSFFLMNARVGLRGRDDRWAIEVWGQNLLNQNYMQVGFNSAFQAGGAYPAGQYPAAQYPGGNQIFSAYLGEPRVYGVTIRTRF